MRPVLYYVRQQCVHVRMSVFELAMSYLLCQHSEYWTQTRKAPNAECHTRVQSPTQRLQTPYDRGDCKKDDKTITLYYCGVVVSLVL